MAVMEAEFWINRWAQQEIGFHRDAANVQLTNHIASLGLKPGSRVLVPLCGKSLDIGWLLTQGFAVCGVELSEQAVSELFAELNRQPELKADGALMHYRAGQLEVFQGDIFALTKVQLGAVDAVYDRAALVALPKPMRDAYTAHLQALTGKAPQLVNLYEYRQEQYEGPPFSVDDSELIGHYGAAYRLELLFSEFQMQGLKEQVNRTEKTWLLWPR